MRDLEAAEPRRQPGGREGLRGADREQRLIVGDQAGKGVVERVEGRADQGRDPPPRIGQRHPPLDAREQRQAKPLLQQANLIADRGLGHPELGRGLGEILMARGGFEDADGAQRRQSMHRPII